MYPYHQNDYTLRSHAEFIDTAKEAEDNATHRRPTSIQGIKGLSCLLQIMTCPQQILLDYMHLVCLGHVQTIVKSWCELIDIQQRMEIDNMLLTTRVPHNVHVVYNESISAVECWKAKHGRLFVLNIGLPIGNNCFHKILIFFNSILCFKLVQLTY